MRSCDESHADTGCPHTVPASGRHSTADPDHSFPVFPVKTNGMFTRSFSLFLIIIPSSDVFIIIISCLSIFRFVYLYLPTSICYCEG